MENHHTAHDELSRKQKRNAELINDIMTIEAKIDEMHQENRRLMQEKNYYESKFNAIQRSAFWKWSKPLRKIRRVFKRQ